MTRVKGEERGKEAKEGDRGERRNKRHRMGRKGEREGKGEVEEEESNARDLQNI